MHVKIVTVNYNGFADTKVFLDSVYEMILPAGYSLSVVVVDNNSSILEKDNLKHYMEQLPNLEFIELENNIGYFPALNVAYRATEQAKECVVLLCNNDLIFESNFLEELSSAVYSDDTFVVAPNVITLEGVHQNPHVLKKISRARLFAYDIYFSWYYFAYCMTKISSVLHRYVARESHGENTESQFIHMGIGACYVLLPAFLEKIDGLDDRVFLGGEEVLLGAQVRRYGGKTYYDNKLIVHHADAATFSSMPKKWRYMESKKSYQIYRQYYV